eukprot:8754221-Heterocapsa_arctica.AAC.1
MAKIRKVRKELLPTGTWTREDSLAALGAYCRAPGAPKCPQAVADAATVIAYLKSGTWGPLQFVPQAITNWEKCI